MSHRRPWESPEDAPLDSFEPSPPRTNRSSFDRDWHAPPLPPSEVRRGGGGTTLPGSYENTLAPIADVLNSYQHSENSVNKRKRLSEPQVRFPHPPPPPPPRPHSQAPIRSPYDAPDRRELDWMRGLHSPSPYAAPPVSSIETVGNLAVQVYTAMQELNQLLDPPPTAHQPPPPPPHVQPLSHTLDSITETLHSVLHLIHTRSRSLHPQEAVQPRPPPPSDHPSPSRPGKVSARFHVPPPPGLDMEELFTAYSTTKAENAQLKHTVTALQTTLRTADRKIFELETDKEVDEIAAKRLMENIETLEETVLEIRAERDMIMKEAREASKQWCVILANTGRIEDGYRREMAALKSGREGVGEGALRRRIDGLEKVLAGVRAVCKEREGLRRRLCELERTEHELVGGGG